MQYNELAKRDVDGDGKMTKGTDVFGTIAQPQHLGFGLYMGAGELVVAKDEKDIPYFRAATSEALDIMVTIADKVGASSAILCADSSEEPKNLDCFQEGLTLFFPEVLKHIETMREYDIDIGILPNPKLSAEQEDYYCYADGYCVNAVAIPITNTESEKVGFVLEAMAAESKNGLTPAYSEVCLSDKYVRDQDSVEMLEMVMDSGILDLGEVFRWNNIASVVSNAIYKGDAIVSTIAANESQIQSSIDKTLEALGIE